MQAELDNQQGKLQNINYEASKVEDKIKEDLFQINE